MEISKTDRRILEGILCNFTLPKSQRDALEETLKVLHELKLASKPQVRSTPSILYYEPLPPSSTTSIQ